ncbi:hypothetical protein [Pseudomonas rhizophila]
MNLSAENIGKIRELVRSGYPLKARDAKDLLGHNDHLVELLEARGRLMLGVEIERDQLKAEKELLQRAGESLADQVKQLKAENEEMVAALNQILRVTPMGVEAFGIAALVLGEMGIGQGEQP